MDNKKFIGWTIAGLAVLWLLVVVIFGRSLDGKVVDFKTGKPVDGAFVRIGSLTTKTDKDGNFHRWGLFSPSTEIMTGHPFYLPITKTVDQFNSNDKNTISLVQASYEEMKTNATIYLKSLSAMVVKLTQDDFAKDKKGQYSINRNEKVIAYTKDAIMYSYEISSNTDDKPHQEELIITDTNPDQPGEVKIVSGRKPPRIYFKDSGKDWVTFSIMDRPDFEIPFDEKNPKEMLGPLEAYGNTSEYDILQTDKKTIDGEELTAIKIYWPKESLLRGKSLTYYFRKSNGNWYDIEFFDDGSNPASKPGRFFFQLLDDRPGLVIQIPKDAKPYEAKNL